MINIGVKCNRKEEKNNKTRKRNGVIGRALPSNCRGSGGAITIFNNYFIIQFLNNLQKKTLSESVNTSRRRAWKLGRL